MDIIYLVEKEAKRRRLSERTISTYTSCLRRFLKWVQKEPRKIKKSDIKDFVYYLTEKNKSGSTVNVYVNAIKFMLEEVLGRRLFLNIKYSKVPKKLPVYLTKEEMKRLINSISNQKHKLMIELMYSSGLRVSELINLKIDDLDLSNNLGWVREGKGKKDRPFIIAEKIIKRIGYYLLSNEIKEGYIFIGWKNKPMSQRSLHNIVKLAGKKARIRKNIHCHTLRHSFATHLVENGYDVTTIQSLLGHSSTKTTMVYIHMADPKIINVKSPLDSL